MEKISGGLLSTNCPQGFAAAGAVYFAAAGVAIVLLVSGPIGWGLALLSGGSAVGIMNSCS